MRRALVVEDDLDIVELVTHYLLKEGWRVDASGCAVPVLSEVASQLCRMR